MKFEWSGRMALGFLAGGLLVAGCGGSQPFAAGSGANLGAMPSVAHKARAHSWMAPGAASKQLLYVSDNSGVVFVFSYPAGALVGKLTDAVSPAGLCSDTKGDVFVPDTPSEDVLEYAHGGTKPIATLNDFGFYPEGCAADPKTGNLAVANYGSAPLQGPGEVAIYTHAQGQATGYTDPDFNEYFFCGYDPKGNLYVDGANAGTTQTEFAELPSGGGTLQTVTLNQTIGYPGGVQWDGKYVALQDTSDDVLYRVKVAGAKGTIAGKTEFSKQHADLVEQFWLQGSTLVMPSGGVSRQAKKVGFWAYPAGGSPTKLVSVAGAVELFGTTVSTPAK